MGPKIWIEAINITTKMAITQAKQPENKEYTGNTSLTMSPSDAVSAGNNTTRPKFNGGTHDHDFYTPIIQFKYLFQEQTQGCFVNDFVMMR